MDTTVKRIDSDDFLIERPFGESSRNLLSEWFTAAELFLDPERRDWDSPQFKVRINETFRSLARHYSRKDQHLFRNLRLIYDTSLTARRQQNPNTTRSYLLLLNNFKFFQQEHASNDDLREDPDRLKLRIFSPLYFLRRMLSSDEYVASDALAHAVIRAEIFAGAARSFPPPSDKNIFEYIKEAITYESVLESVQKFESYTSARDTYYPNKITDFIVGNLLASHGLASLVLSRKEGQKTTRSSERNLMSINYFLQNRSIDFTPDSAYEFRIVRGTATLPSTSQILTELDGIPVAIPGLGPILSGGIRMTDSGGVVIRLSGKSGTGKTSFSLALCAALAPLGTKTFYLSCEEQRADLIDRINSVTPPFLRNTESYTPPQKHASNLVEEWFFSDHLDSVKAATNLQRTREFLESILANYEKRRIRPGRHRPPGTIPFIIVLDGIHELLGHRGGQSDIDVEALHGIISQFRKLNSMVVIVSAEVESAALRELDYLVDVVFKLDNKDYQKAIIENVRFIHLEKTRRQFSSSGSHRYHISKRTGVKIFPSLDSMRETFKRFQWSEPDETQYYDFLGPATATKKAPQPWLKIFARSQILVTGKGSTGKAQFGIRLLSSPLLENRPTERTLEMFGEPPQEIEQLRRILVISFLYPESYYHRLLTRVARKQPSDRISRKPAPRTVAHVLTLYPGYISAEVLLGKVADEIRKGQIQGVPYHGVLLDGLHNVFLQFPNIENTPMIWPTLSELFRRLGLTVVTTHAHFDVVGMETDQKFASDVHSWSSRSAPLLQMLVNSADFYLDVSPATPQVQVNEGWPTRARKRGLARIQVATALDQSIPRDPSHFWNRKDMIVEVMPNNITPE